MADDMLTTTFSLQTALKLVVPAMSHADVHAYHSGNIAGFKVGIRVMQPSRRVLACGMWVSERCLSQRLSLKKFY